MDNDQKLDNNTSLCPKDGYVHVTGCLDGSLDIFNARIYKIPREVWDNWEQNDISIDYKLYETS